MRRISRARALIVLVLAQLTLAPDAGSTPGSAISEPTTMTIHGARDKAGGCSYTMTLVLQPGERSIDAHEIDEVVATCTIVMEVVASTDPADESTPPSGYTAASSTSTVTQASSTAPPAAAAAAAYQDSAGYFRTWFTGGGGSGDLLVSVKDRVAWSWNGSKVGTTFECGDTRVWHSSSGWNETSWDINCTFGNNLSFARTATKSHYKNGFFCLTIDTDIDYNRNRATGKANGDLVGSVDWSKTGGCTGLIDVHYHLERTLN